MRQRPPGAGPYAKPLLITLLLSILFNLHLFTGTLYAATSDWDAGMRQWLLSLTYPDERPDDFGVATPPEDRALLERFRPRVIISPGGLLPVDFYGFYLPKTVVRDLTKGGEVVRRSPTRKFLKSIERKRRYYLDYTGPLYPCTGEECQRYIAAGYGRVYRETAVFRTDNGVKKIPVIILKYNFAFPYSGMPAVLGLLKEALLKIAADPVRFHELDIHGAVQIILNSRMRPMVLLLAEHNYFRSYVIGRDVPSLPADGRLPVCFAERSNEPYPCPAGPVPALHRTVGNPVYMGYVIDGRSRPLTSGIDRVYGLGSGGREIKYSLRFPPSRDPLYVSWIPLGDRKKFLFFKTFYRNGPPGMDLNSHPDLKRYGDMMQFWYLRDGNAEDAALMRESLKGFIEIDARSVLEQNGRRLFSILNGLGYIPSSAENRRR